MAERAHPEDAGFQDQWFGLKKNPYKQRLFERYAFCNDWVQDKVVLDIPCGSGWGTSMLKRCRHVYGIDISREAIGFAKERYEQPGRMEFSTGDMSKIPLEDDSIDVLICLEGFEHVERDVGAAFIDEAVRVLRRDGVLIMTCPVLDERGEDSGNPFHLCEYPEEELLELLNKRFRVRSIERIDGPDGPEYRAVVTNIKGQRYRS